MSNPPLAGELKTTVRLTGEPLVDQFRSVAYLLGRRPHQLAHDLVLEALRAHLQAPEVAEAVAGLVRVQQEARAQDEARNAPNVIDIHTGRRHNR